MSSKQLRMELTKVWEERDRRVAKAIEDRDIRREMRIETEADIEMWEVIDRYSRGREGMEAGWWILRLQGFQSDHLEVVPIRAVNSIIWAVRCGKVNWGQPEPETFEEGMRKIASGEVIIRNLGEKGRAILREVLGEEADE